VIHAVLLSVLAGGASHLMDATQSVPDLMVDLRYATADNFLKQAVYPPGAKCLLLPTAVEHLAGVAKALHARGYRLLAWDCYRPLAVQRKMWELYPVRGYVADPNWGGSHHNRGAAIDLTLVTKSGEPVEMPTPFDTFSRAAHSRYDGGTKSSRAHRDILIEAMEAAGFKRNPMEWWHFDLPNAIDYAILDEPLTGTASSN
jgi:D-alanyl-D-alanine dipeptidase